MKPIRLAAVIDLRASEAGKPRRFDILAYTGGILRLTGFPLPVVVDLSGLQVPPSVPILIDHTKAVDATLGFTDAIENDGRTLRMTGAITGTSERSQQVLAQADAGHPWQASIGATSEVTEEIPAGQSVVVNGQQFVGPLIVARRSVLRETSVLPMGADASTVVNLAAAAAGLGGGAVMSFEDWLATLGIDPATLTDAGKAALMSSYDAAMNSTPAPAPAAPVAAATPAAAAAPVNPPAVAAAADTDIQASIAQGRQQLAAENRRIAEIKAKCAGYELIAATAIEQGWTAEKAELEAMKEKQRARAPAAHIRSNVLQSDVIEAALCLTAGLPGIEKRFKPETLDAASRQYRNFGLQQCIIMAAASNGWTCGPGERLHRGNLEDALYYAFPRREIRAEGMSTVSLSGILSNVANKELLSGYMEEDQTWKEISAVKSVPDFKQVTSYRMLDNMEYEQVGKGGEIKNGTVDSESYTRQAKTYAKMFTLTREDIINDDLGAFDDIRNRLGAGAAKKLNKVFWTAFLNNSSFFTSGRGNYISGATTTLLTDGVGLGLGVKAFRQLKSPSADGAKKLGTVVGGQPEILLVPPELEEAADRLYTSDNFVGSTSQVDRNTYRGKYRPVVCPWLSDSDFTGYSTTAWYLLRGPGQYPAAVVSFLNGQQTPTVESSETTFDRLGIQFRGYHDFGVDLAEYLCGIKSKGAA